MNTIVGFLHHLFVLAGAPYRLGEAFLASVPATIAHGARAGWHAAVAVWHAWLGYCIAHPGFALLWLAAAALTTAASPFTVRPSRGAVALLTALTVAGGFGLGYVFFGGAA